VVGVGAQAPRIGFGELMMNLLHGRIARLLGHFAAVSLAFPVVDFVVIIGAHFHASIALYKRQLPTVSRGLPVMRVGPDVDKYTPVSGPCKITWIKSVQSIQDRRIAGGRLRQWRRICASVRPGGVFFPAQGGALECARHAGFVKFGELEMRDPRAGIRRLFGGPAAMLRSVPVIMKIVQRTRSNHDLKTDQCRSAFPMKRLTCV